MPALATMDDEARARLFRVLGFRKGGFRDLGIRDLGFRVSGVVV